MAASQECESVEMMAPQGPGHEELSAAAESAEGGDDDARCGGHTGAPAAGAPRGAPGGTWLPVRVELAALCFLMEVIAYSDRTNITLAIIGMQKSYGYGDSLAGLVLAAFFTGYATTQIPGGWLAQRLGARRVLACGVALWSLMTVLTPAAASAGIGVLLAARVLLGVGEGVSLPCVHHMAGRWAPRSERARFLTACTSGQLAGTTLVMLAAPVAEYDWRLTFYIFGAAGLVWTGVWLWRVADAPELHPRISSAELRWIRSGTAAAAGISWGAPPWRALVTEPAVMAVCCAHVAHNWGWYLLLSWLPKFFNCQLNVPLGQSGLLLVVPYGCPVLMSNCSGHLADLAHNKAGWSLQRTRRTMQSVAFVFPALSLLGLALAAPRGGVPCGAPELPAGWADADCRAVPAGGLCVATCEVANASAAFSCPAVNADCSRKATALDSALVSAAADCAAAAGDQRSRRTRPPRQCRRGSRRRCPPSPPRCSPLAPWVSERSATAASGPTWSTCHRGMRG
eukprot:TRINITY_DN31697_c0_g1_i2.p1 TRINITY_DN31697_c0_g1~~TRINITY_DN31697_c0_g1_i2.p1  ORF type:complete len:537 (+),score=95.26 TRINITY_DN31697_c0_g1_i2:77-1612(+)